MLKFLKHLRRTIAVGLGMAQPTGALRPSPIQVKYGRVSPVAFETWILPRSRMMKSNLSSCSNSAIPPPAKAAMSHCGVLANSA